MKRISIYILLLAVFSGNIYSQYNGKNFSFSVSYSYTTTSKLFLQPNSPDPLIRGIHENLDDIYNYSVEFRYRISEPLIIGLSAESIKKTFINRNLIIGGLRAEMTDGYKLYLMELSIYYLLPFSTEQFKFYMGGGSGFYTGEHIRQFGDVNFEKEKREIGYGIHIAVGMDYLITDYFSIRGQMRFRDPEVEMKSKYSNNIVHYADRTFLISTNTFSSKVNIDGATFVISAVLIF